jgi:AraC-like DNA-binding protein
MPTPTIAAGYPRGLVAFALSKGADRAALLARAGITEDALAHQDNRVPLDRYLALFNAAAELTGMPAISLEYGKAVRMQEISIVGLIGEACESVLDVPVQINRYANLVIDEEHEGEPAILMRGAARDGGVWIEGPSALFTDHAVIAETEMARLVWNTRTTFANDPVFQEMEYPIVVHLMRKPPEYAAEYERIFGAPVVFESAWNAMQIDPRFLLLKQPPVNRYVFAVLSERADALLESFNESRTTAGRVKGVLMKMLHTGEASMDAVAGKLGQSRQTLYRNLKDEGFTYEQVLDDLRRKLALDFLAAKKVSVNETAYLVGFSDPASFSRAFKRWTGKSPSEVRLSAQKRGAA